MPRLMELIAQPYLPAWAAVLVIVAYYAVLSTALHWRPKRPAIVTQYKPPDKISPAVAACLMEDGRFERAFAAALVSLAAKGHIEIQQQNDWYVLNKMRGAAADLSPEESGILARLFSESPTYAFNATDCDQLCFAYGEFRTIMDGITDPDLISPHTFLWVIGLVFSAEIPFNLFLALPGIGARSSAWSVAYCAVWAAIGASCLVSAVRIWPNTLRKIASLLSFNRAGTGPLNLNDATPIFLTATAAMGFAFLAITSSVQFAILTAALVLVLSFARRALEAPTAYGRKVIVHLGGFREFLLRADADRLTRENSPGAAPGVLEAYIPYAVAFDIDCGWGRDFASGVTELIEYERGVEPWSDYSENSYLPTELNLRSKRDGLKR
jgi:hypothetical protein